MSNSRSDIDNLFVEISDKLGISFVPQIFLTLRSQPTLLESIWQLVDNTLLSGNMHRIVKELIFVVTANEKNCRYCSVAHKALAFELGVSKSLLDSIDRDFKQVRPNSLRYTLHFAQSLASNDLKQAQHYTQRMKDKGVSEQELEEAISMASVATFMTTLANGMALNDKVDEGFTSILA